LDDLHTARGSKAILAGGTDLMIQLRNLGGSTIRLVDITRIPQLSGIEQRNGDIWIGPLTTMAELAASAVVNEKIPVLAKAAASVGSPQIRNRATIGGNLCHASPCADTVPPLVALNAILQLRSKRRTRQLTVEDFVLGAYRVGIDTDEILEGIQIPIPSPRMSMMFYKLGRRKALATARLNLVVGLRVADGRIADAVLSPGSIMPSPKRLWSIEKKLIDQKPTSELFRAVGREVAELMVMESGERWSTPYKKPVVETVVAKCLNQCLRGRL
jgi:xanthine dehydrogenase FAD-binding subunit